MSAPAATGLRIGEVARRVGTTPRTIRYYEEIGLLPAPTDRPAGGHRLYTESDVERLADALRLKALLGVGLEELATLLDVQDARALLREEWRHGGPDDARKREILHESLALVETQLGLVRRRAREIAELQTELEERQARSRELLAELDA